jgi:hypothetical protein
VKQHIFGIKIPNNVVRFKICFSIEYFHIFRTKKRC